MHSEPTSSNAADALRELPSVDVLLRQHAIASLLEEHPRAEVLAAIRVTLEARRRRIRSGAITNGDTAALALEVREALYRRSRPSLRRVINATGIVLHTGLGRAPLADEAVEAVAAVAGGYSNLELDLETGERGDRHAHTRGLLCELTGAEDAVVVNNNAGATYLALRALAAGREVIVSRGQLVEIGGSYRMPDIMAAAGCRMVEVGTTNRTRIGDYRAAVTDATAVLLRVHPSNFRIVGFTESATLEELVALARSASPGDIAVVDDLGSGLLGALPGRAGDPDGSSPRAAGDAPAGSELVVAWDEPSVRGSVAAGADLTLFSGDKLLGGPQAGIVVGRARPIARLRADPLMRALRPDKLTLAALEATLRLYRDPEALRRRLPAYQMLLTEARALESPARLLATALASTLSEWHIVAEPGESFAGGGALPAVALPTWIVRMRHPRIRSDALAAALRQRETPVIGRIQDAALIFDLRTLRGGETEELLGAVIDGVREFDERVGPEPAARRAAAPRPGPPGASPASPSPSN